MLEYLSPQQPPHNTASRNDEPSVEHDQERLHQVNLPSKARGVVDARVGRIRYGLAEEGAERRPAVLGLENEQLLPRHGRDDLLRRRVNNELNFPPNFEELVLGCIDADFCK